jgi:hypothetical protein
MPIVHPCARPSCETLTMGTLCLEHEQQPDLNPRSRFALLHPLNTAGALVAAAAVGYSSGPVSSARNAKTKYGTTIASDGRRRFARS